MNCGNENAVEFTLTPFLRAQGVNKIPRLVLTEGDARNIGGAQLLDELFGVRRTLHQPGVDFVPPVYREAVTEFEQAAGRATRSFNCGEIIG